jgi:hypothetical protein
MNNILASTKGYFSMLLLKKLRNIDGLYAAFGVTCFERM